jgi:hypothetical protein
MPIVERELAEVYGLQDSAILYDNSGLAVAMKNAINILPEQRDILTKGLAQLRKNLLYDAQENIKETLISVGINLPS